MTELVGYALRYARAGVPVFPCWPGRKIPVKALAPHGSLSATTDLGVVRAWWTARPDASIAARTGRHIVIDLDGPEGEAGWALLEAEHGPVVTAETRTCRHEGGRHLWFLAAETVVIGCSNKRLPPGIDVRGRNGFALLPPSLHASGRRYAWQSTRPIARLPAWLVELTRKRERPITPPATRPRLPAPGVDRTRYGIVALRAETDRVRQAAESTRNNTLNLAGFALGQLVASGHLPRTLVEDELTDAALAAGLEPLETKLTIASAVDAGEAHPRSPADAA